MEVTPVDVLHHDVVRVALVVDVVDADDVRVVEPGGGAGFELEPRQVRAVFDPLTRQHLDRHASFHHQVLGEVDVAHAPFADLAEELVFAEPETAMLTGEELVRLPTRQQAVFDQKLGDLLLVFGQLGPELLKKPVETLRRNELAALDKVDQLFGASL